MLEFGQKVVRAGFFYQVLLHLDIIRTPPHGVTIRFVPKDPLDVAKTTLDPTPFPGRRSDDILNHPAGKARFRPEVYGADLVVVNIAVVDIVDHGADLDHFAGAEKSGHVLPQINGVRVLSGGAATAPPMAEVAVGGAVEPGVGREDASPMLAEFHV